MKKVNNKDVLQSYILTTAKYDYSVYEKRILYRLVEIAQCETQGLKFSEDCRKIEHDLFGLVTVTLPIASVLANEDDKNYKKAKDALVALSQKYIIYEDSEIWEKLNIVVFPKIEKRKSTFTFTLAPKIWDVILDFSKGYRKLELKTAMEFESVYSMRFYELMSGQNSPIDYTIEKLKSLFQVENKYKQVNDFLRFIIEPAKRELDAKSPYTFTYSIIKEGRKYKSIRFFPVYQPKFRDDDLERKNLQKQVSLSWDLDSKIIDYLKTAFDFDTKEIKQNIDLFKKAQNELEFINFISIVKPRANRANNPKGYLINAIKKELGI